MSAVFLQAPCSPGRAPKEPNLHCMVCSIHIGGGIRADRAILQLLVQSKT